VEQVGPGTISFFKSSSSVNYAAACITSEARITDNSADSKTEDGPSECSTISEKDDKGGKFSSFFPIPYVGDVWVVAVVVVVVVVVVCPCMARIENVTENPVKPWYNPEL